jgi:hypothetical protein
MPILLTCECGKQLRVRDENAGRRFKCPACGHVLVAPPGGGEAAVQAAPAAGPPRADRIPGGEPEGTNDEHAGRGPRGRRGPRTSGKAIASLVFGLLSFCLWVFAAVPAFILGALSLRDIKRSDGRLKGRELAVAGLITAGLGTLVVVPLAVILPAVQKVREAANRAKATSNLRQITVALRNYEGQMGHLPAAVLQDPDGQPYSWRVAILPWLEQEDLFTQYNRREPWDSPANKAVLAKMPPVFACLDHPGADPSATCYLALVGPGAAFEPGRKVQFSDIRDGPSNTILVAEAAEAVPWTKPADLTFTPGGPLPAFSTSRPGGFLAEFADESVRLVSRTADPGSLRALITRSGKDKIAPGTLPGP